MSNAVDNARAGRIDGLYAAWNVAMMVQGGVDVAASIKAVIRADITVWRNSSDYPFDEATISGYPAWVWTK